MIQQSEMSRGAALKRRAGRKMLVLLAGAVAMLIAGGWAASASAAPVLQVDQVANHQIPRVAGDLELEAVVRNVGTDPTNGDYAIEYELPAGLAALSISGTGWVCDLPTLSCVRSAALAAGAAAPKVTLYVDIDENVPEALVTHVSASGGDSVEAFSEQRLLTDPEFGIKSLKTEVNNKNGVEYTQAGGHPFSAQAEFWLNSFRSQRGFVDVIENVKDVITELPPGFVGNPNAADECEFTFQMRLGQCSLQSAVGYAMVSFAFGDYFNPFASGSPVGVYRLKAKPGYAATFAFEIQGVPVLLNVSVRSESDFGVTVTAVGAPQLPQTGGVQLTLCGQGTHVELGVYPPSTMTFDCVDLESPYAYSAPLLTNPADCTVEGPTTMMFANSWQQPSVWKGASYASPQVTGCDDLTFEPTVDIKPTTSSPDAPSGLDVAMRFPTEDNEAGLAPPPLKKAVVTMPEGMTINPAAANGLGACSDEQLNLRNRQPVDCPESAKIGSVTATTPVLDETLSGGVYIRSQNSDDPESGEMFRLALVLENKERGLSIRLPGQVRVNKDTGRIETTFDNNPQLPVESIDLKLKQGPRAPLATPPMCGEKSIETVLASWDGQIVERNSAFDVDCSPGLGGFAPGFAAGTVSSVAGVSSPFSLSITRQDGEKELKAIKSVRLPEGLLGRVASVPLCGEAQADLGACARASRVGHVQVAAGAGPNPLWVPEANKQPTAVYLSGPYKGAPYSLSIVVPAQAGPFDLGRVVVRAALHVDERTARITSGVDETRLIDAGGTVTEVLPEALPRILKGVVLNQREIRLIMDREDFMVNPTDCSQKQIAAEIYSYGNDRVDVGNRFRAADCALLGFAPKLRARILDKGRKSTVRSWHPRTRFTVVPRKGDANIGGARVALPSSTILDQSNIGTTCTRAQMAERACPAKSLVGYAKAWSPLLRKAVEGPVYLAANGGVRPLPDLAAVLDGEIRVVLQGEISTLRTGGKARLQNTFRVVPDAPVSRFILTMRGGKNTGLLVNSTDLCRTKERGVAVFHGQNGKRHRSNPKIATTFKGCGKVRRQAARRAAKRKAIKRKAARRAAAQSAAGEVR